MPSQRINPTAHRFRTPAPDPPRISRLPPAPRPDDLDSHLAATRLRGAAAVEVLADPSEADEEDDEE